MTNEEMLKAAKGQAMLDKFYSLLKDEVTDMDGLVAASIAMSTLLAYTIAKISPGDRGAQLRVADTMAETVRQLIESSNPNVESLQ